MVAGERFQDVVAAARADAGPSRDLEIAMRRMRSEGFTPIECIKGLMIIAEIPLAEAKRILHFSETWADIREDQERFQRSLADEAEREL